MRDAPLRMGRWALLLCGLLLALAAVAAQTSPPTLRLSRLDADPPAAQVVAGTLDARFVAVPDAVIAPPRRGPGWWRVTALQSFPAGPMPQLVLRSPYLNRVQAWVPGASAPVTRSLTGRDADLQFSTRALVLALPDGLARGQRVYLRVDAGSTRAMPLAIEPLAQVHYRDLRHVALRNAPLVTMLVLAVLALGFWIGVGERSYAYLLVTLVAQVLYLVSTGGEIRAWPWLAALVEGDVRPSRMFAGVAVIACLGFTAFYLELARTQPRALRAIKGCMAAMAALLLVNVGTDAAWVTVAANLMVLAAMATVLVAAVGGTLQGQRAAYFLLISWLPMLAMVALRVGESLGGWLTPEWMTYAFPAGFALAGLVLTVGLADSMQQLRRDRDRASRLASTDALTSAMSRPAIDQCLRDAVAQAHRTGMPMSVVFFDIDHFKHINDEHGHRAGDECLRIMTLRTRNRLRRYDQIGRFGGDEMLVILPDTALAEACGVAENLRSAVNARPLAVEQNLLRVTLSLGVAQLQPGETPEQLLARADAALYMSKFDGRDRVTGKSAVGRTTQEQSAYMPR